jgi:hypothetical protein
VQHPHDGDLAVRVAVVEGVLLVEMDPQARREFVTARPQLRVNQQRREARLDFSGEGLEGGCQATPKTAPLTTIEIAPLDYSGYSGFRKPVLA